MILREPEPLYSNLATIHYRNSKQRELFDAEEHILGEQLGTYPRRDQRGL